MNYFLDIQVNNEGITGIVVSLFNSIPKISSYEWFGNFTYLWYSSTLPVILLFFCYSFVFIHN